MSFYAGICIQAVLAALLGSAVQRLDPEVLLEGYNRCNKEFETISYDLESDSQSEMRRLVYAVKHCSGNENRQWIGYRTLYSYYEPGARPVRERVADMCNSTQVVHLFADVTEDRAEHPPQAILYGLAGGRLPTIRKEWAEAIEYGGPLVGKVFGSDYRSVYDLLKGAAHVTLHDATTKILDYEAYLLEADTQYGIVRAWISPAAGNNCLKWEIIKAQHQFYRDGETANDRFTHWIAAYEAERVEQIDGRYITTQARFKYAVKDGTTQLSDFTHHYRLTNIDLDPDYEAMRAFTIQLPEGTVVIDKDFPGVQYRWMGGRLQPLTDDSIVNALAANVDHLRENRDTLPGTQDANSDGDAAVRQPTPVPGEARSRAVAANVNTEGTKKCVFYVLSAVAILAAAFCVYRYRRPGGGTHET